MKIIFISHNGIEKEFTIKGYTKDALFGSQMVGITRFLVSDNDAELFNTENTVICRAVEVHTNDKDYPDKLCISGFLSFVDHLLVDFEQQFTHTNVPPFHGASMFTGRIHSITRYFTP